MGTSTRWVSDPRAIACLRSALRQRVLDRLETIGPASAADLAGSLALAPDRMYYHLKCLLDVGLIVEAGVRGVGRHQQVLYDLPVKHWHLAYDPDDPERVTAINKLTASMLREARRDFEQGWQHPKAKGAGSRRTQWSLRLEGYLNNRELAQLNHHLQAIVDLLRKPKPKRRRSGTHVALTWILAPLRTRLLESSRRKP